MAAREHEAQLVVERRAGNRRVVEILAASVPIRALLWGKVAGASVLAIGQTVVLAAAGAIRLEARYDDQHGVLDVGRLVDLVPDFAERRTFACGPAGLLDALEAHIAALASEAVAALQDVDIAPLARAELLALADFVVARVD